tara:strand:- start:58 stop:234 length:177 start_codon:yes stop_codon:yes gene_type:complete
MLVVVAEAVIMVALVLKVLVVLAVVAEAVKVLLLLLGMEWLVQQILAEAVAVVVAVQT